MGVCLVLAAAASASHPAPVFIATERFTLAWTHSIEKVRWEEDYEVLGPATPGAQPVLHATEARIRGSAAGMEPPTGATLRNGWYTYPPAQRQVDALPLSRSEFVPDYELCMQGRCRSLSQWLPSDGGVTLLTACLAP
ncbi:MAG: DUF1850 domain-containing protein [Comamonadaceae bacterium]|nr:DUF1850 domain-containing protein [Comamonadaceae bacterium]